MTRSNDELRASFGVGDAVWFQRRGKRTEGHIERTNPKRAVVRVGPDAYSVPYELLQTNPERAEERAAKIRATRALAETLLREHGLNEWTFEFDHSTRRAGRCSYTNRVISVAFDLALNESTAEFRETMLHEIAHALVGKKAGHGPVWKAKAREIGCSARRTHQLNFSRPRWNVTCENGCWTQTAQRRNPRLICRTCGARLVYTPYAAR